MYQRKLKPIAAHTHVAIQPFLYKYTPGITAIYRWCRLTYLLLKLYLVSAMFCPGQQKCILGIHQNMTPTTYLLTESSTLHH